MTTTGKTITAIVVIVIIALGIWWYSASRRSSDMSMPAGMQNMATTTDTVSGGSDTTGVSATDTSNAALNQDMTSVSGQMNGLNSDSASADESMNDQPVPQQ